MSSFSLLESECIAWAAKHTGGKHNFTTGGIAAKKGGK